jgi:Ca2+-binding EF-hand superfamily protein
MALFDDMKKLADKNGDGKITKEDWDKFKSEADDATREKLDGFEKSLSADSDGDFDFEDVKQHFGNLKERLFGGK